MSEEVVILGHRCAHPSAAEKALRRVERAFRGAALDAAAGARGLAADGLDRYVSRLEKAVGEPGYLGPAGGWE